MLPDDAATPGGLDIRLICGGVLVQEFDAITAPGDDPAGWTLAAGAAAVADLLATSSSPGGPSGR